ncbi:SpoIIE family protein phosphatase/ATP-binding protein [Streptomyces avermitilis]|uniref:Magnesium or manganese-dependent protein phosphatase n=1 Tax=Streptomyces avermitilis (strain ATCC 31267 / DSM 46492 / JCM 5070 / NBRC 14893 / NCIMB 12804 / NRRL 8165 / MA-4680) TaxID=227882 RepID=Q82FV1_STRAW|nr:putative magnesium or manganese-dependent protein phosphatase [Streptomyces avermitilis MA-4680 = NBRC 14893]
MFLLQVVIVVLLVVAAVAAMVLEAAREAVQQAQRDSVVAAQSFASAPGMVEALRGPHPTAVLQPRAEEARKKAGVDFVVVMNTRGIRYTYPYPQEIGKKFVGTIEPALHGRTVVEQAGGPPLPTGEGTAVQAVVPVTDARGTVVGLVSAGITVKNVARLWLPQLPIALGAGAAAVALAGAGTTLVSRRLLRQTRGLAPAELAGMYEHHDAVLHAVREGVLIIDADGRLVLANDEAKRLLGLPGDARGSLVRELGLPEQITRLLTSPEEVTDEVLLAEDRLLAVNKRPTFPDEGRGGSVVTLRDTTELATVSGRAEVARERLKLLYEAGVRIGTTLDVRCTAQELADVAVPQFAGVVTVDLLDSVLQGWEPTAEGWRRLRRAAIGGEHEMMPMYPLDEVITFSPKTPQMLALNQGQGVLEADLRQARGWQEQDPERARAVLERGVHSLVSVPLRARSVSLGVANFYRTGDSPAFEPEDLSFAEELAARAAVAIDNARRFTREHAMAVTLQRSLLPRGQPEQDALEVAWRYLPAEAGVGGDWFDVIPLPGGRVALVMGDVVGHGLHAAATMGRLRTAVHNFSTLDLPVDEVLGNLDDLVIRMDNEESADDAAQAHEGEGVTGATCLYAIYEPVTGACTVARAGHPDPIVVRPDGTVTCPDVPASAPLGLGSHPFETAELHLPEGSQLVLYTDGLVRDRTRDPDVGLDGLRLALKGAGERTPGETCQAVIDALKPTHPSDDIALLVARTRLFPPSHVAEWDVPSDPAVVPSVRARCREKLREWGLEESEFTTELILSELVTNAIRYGSPPVTVRLLYGRCLSCEVSDASSTSPRLRRAATTDEGGRGLFLVAQFAERWGTRYTPYGKVIWAEQTLHDSASAAPAHTPIDVLLEQFGDPAM